MQRFATLEAGLDELRDLVLTALQAKLQTEDLPADDAAEASEGAPGGAEAADLQAREPDGFEVLPHPPGALAGQAATPKRPRLGKYKTVDQVVADLESKPGVPPYRRWAHLVRIKVTDFGGFSLKPLTQTPSRSQNRIKHAADAITELLESERAGGAAGPSGGAALH